ncbi:AAA domain protein [uncultured archaeon]|nr:AAA domain protein [uncultured archaeon]
MVNPYDPQNPAKPDFFGGRSDILRVAKERMDKALVHKQSGGVLVYGYRGVGKTSLIKKVISLANEIDNQTHNVIVIDRRLSKTTSDTELYQIITETAVEQINQRKNLAEKVKDKVASAGYLRVLEIEFNFDKNWEQKTPYFKWTSFIQNVKGIGLILVAIDDADYLSPEALGELKTIVEGRNPTPILLVVSGGIEFEERLVEDYSPIARIFSGASFNLGEFKIAETAEVLQKPLVDLRTKWEREAIDEVQLLSRGYPYLVQCIASASFVEDGNITVDRVKNSRDAALEIGKPWLSHELENSSDKDIEGFLKIIQLNKPIFKSSELQNAGISPPYIGRLVKLNVIKQINRGRYSLQKPPIIAYYHALIRNLSI